MSRCRDELCHIPGIGEKLSAVLNELGYTKTEQLCGADPEQMYQRLNTLRGETVDRCVLYTFRCAVYYASNTAHDAKKLKWWYWKDRRE